MTAIVCAAIARRPQALQGRAGVNTEVVFGDCFDPESLSSALAGVHTAYYLVHSMGSAGSFEEKDRQAASNFAEAARPAKVQRIIYLGGLGEGALSPHLRSRQEVGEALRSAWRRGHRVPRFDRHRLGKSFF